MILTVSCSLRRSARGAAGPARASGRGEKCQNEPGSPLGLNVEGTLDLAAAITLTTIYGAADYMGAAYWIPAFWVPALLVTHYIMFAVLSQKGLR